MTPLATSKPVHSKAPEEFSEEGFFKTMLPLPLLPNQLLCQWLVNHQDIAILKRIPLVMLKCKLKFRVQVLQSIMPSNLLNLLQQEDLVLLSELLQ